MKTASLLFCLVSAHHLKNSVAAEKPCIKLLDRKLFRKQRSKRRQSNYWQQSGLLPKKGTSIELDFFPMVEFRFLNHGTPATSEHSTCSRKICHSKSSNPKLCLEIFIGAIAASPLRHELLVSEQWWRRQTAASSGSPAALAWVSATSNQLTPGEGTGSVTTA